ncbi:18932_t:CDS:1 [Racocetra fulgida]|uniref:18932_t:CDS:1 n=1 Tax=Racocetra fulgida TaxID=60492 RepID=A0A9N9D2A6_9GLOM|nr:18932_t:CDS:1 [Racocetra fulgida]
MFEENTLEENTFEENTLETNILGENTLKEDTIEEDIIEEDIIEEGIIKENTIEEDIIEEDIIDENTIEENTLKEDTIEEDIIEEGIIKENTIEEDIIEEDMIDENTIEENTLKEDTIEEDIIEENTIEENAVKEDITNSSLETPLTEDEKINIKYCQEKTCKFLFPYFHPEQESRANVHARVYTQLARTLNRTLVLSNVGDSRIRACTLYTFDFYYDLKAFRKRYPDIRFITQNKFFEWTKERKIRPIAQNSWMIQDGRNDSLSVREKKIMSVEEGVRFGSKRLESFCIDVFNLNITNYKEFHTGVKKIDHEALLKFVTNTLKTPPMTEEYEVIMILNKSPREYFPYISEPIPYSPYILKESKRIINKLKPYIAVHWRMEQVEPKLMPECARKLVKTLKKIQKQYGIKNVYLATDFPLNGGKSQSDTFYIISKFHEEAIKILGLNDSFVNSPNHIKYNTWLSMGAFSQIRDDPKYESEFKGSGIPGILDKLISINAKYFLRGPKGCARIRSTFTQIIVEERKKLKKKYGLINTVSVW